MTSLNVLVTAIYYNKCVNSFSGIRAESFTTPVTKRTEPLQAAVRVPAPVQADDRQGTKIARVIIAAAVLIVPVIIAAAAVQIVQVTNSVT